MTPVDGLCPAGGCGSICLRTFADDSAAVAPVSEYEARLAIEDGRSPRSVVPTTDDRFVRTRALVERTWEMFRASRPVGALDDQRISLVMLEDAKANAFVSPIFGFTIVVQTGLLDVGTSDDALVAVLAHELQHLLGQDASATERLRNFYIAPEGVEPIGRNQADDPDARRFGEAWRDASDDVGEDSLEALDGLPLDGQLARVFRLALAHGASCDGALLDKLRADIKAARDRVTGELHFDGTLSTRVQQVLDNARTCLASYTDDFIDLVAEIGNTSRTSVIDRLSTEDRALVERKPIVDGIANLVRDRRAAMRGAETDFETITGRPWSALRFFSREEDADDVTVTVLRAAGLPPDSLKRFMTAVVPACANVSGVPPYGIDLLDDHHATCWRGYHVSAIATAPSVRFAPVHLAHEVHALPIPRSVRDEVVY